MVVLLPEIPEGGIRLIKLNKILLYMGVVLHGLLVVSSLPIWTCRLLLLLLCCWTERRKEKKHQVHVHTCKPFNIYSTYITLKCVILFCN